MKIFYVLLYLILASIIITNAQTWRNVGTGANHYVGALAKYNGNLIVAGSFTNAGGLNVNYIAQWDSVNWSQIGQGFYSDCFALTTDTVSNTLYAGGNNLIAKWDGTAWNDIDSGITGYSTILALEMYQNNLYAAGILDTISGLAVNQIAKWDGVNWSRLGNGVTGGITGTKVQSLFVFNNELYVGGSFANAGGVPANNIAKWNGTNWSPVGTGLNGEVVGFAEYNSQLIAVGYFAITGKRGVAKWDGNSWTPMGSMPTNWINSVGIYHNELYIGGFISVQGLNNFARWDGSDWVDVGGGNNSSIDVMMEYKNEFYVGGNFTVSGSLNTDHISRWYSPWVGVNENIYSNISINLFPNPFSLKATIHSDNYLNNATLKVYNSLGAEIKSINHIYGYVQSIERDYLPDGFYYYKLTQSGIIISQNKLLIIGH